MSDSASPCDIIAVIPARGGSKGIPRKNLHPLGGKPLLQWTAEAALGCQDLRRVILSTDDEEIASAGQKFGLEVPFLRPAELAGDSTPIVSVLQHLLTYLSKRGQRPEALALLQPTSPLRRSHHISEAVAIFKRQEADTLVSVTAVPHNFNPLSVMTYEQGKLVPLSDESPLRRQDKPIFYARNGPAILILRSSQVEQGKLYGKTTIPYIMDKLSSIDIDEPIDLVVAEAFLKQVER